MSQPNQKGNSDYLDPTKDITVHVRGSTTIPWLYDDIPLPPPGTPVYLIGHVCPKDCNCIKAYVDKAIAEAKNIKK
jgi:hypothetical protein